MTRQRKPRSIQAENITPLTFDAQEVGRHECPVCPAKFKKVGDKKRHMRTKHTKQAQR